MGSMLPPTKARKLPPSLLRSVRHDPHGDTVLAQISPTEAAHLIGEGGAGVPNRRFPEMLHFFGGFSDARQAAGLDHPSGGGAGNGNSGNGSTNRTVAPGNAMAVSRPAAVTTSTPERNIYSDIKVANPTTGRIYNPNIYGGIVSEKNGLKFSTGNDDLAYNSALDKYGQRTLADRVMNFFAPVGLTSVKPDYSRPATYAGGDFHIGINPASAVAGLAAGFLGPGVGAIAGPAAGMAYDALGLKDPVLTGPRTIYADDGTGGTELSSGSPSAAPGTGAPSTPGVSAGGGRGSLLPPITGNGQTAPLPAPAAPPVSGSMLPPTGAQQAGGVSPEQYFAIPGPSPYGYRRPAWTF